MENEIPILYEHIFQIIFFQLSVAYFNVRRKLSNSHIGSNTCIAFKGFAGSIRSHLVSRR